MYPVVKKSPSKDRTF